MKIAFYLDSFYNSYHDNVPVVIKGKDQDGLDC